MDVTRFDVSFVEAPLKITDETIYSLIKDLSLNDFLAVLTKNYQQIYQFNSLSWISQEELVKSVSNQLLIFKDVYSRYSIADKGNKWQIIQNFVNLDSRKVAQSSEDIVKIYSSFIYYVYRDTVQTEDNLINLSKDILNRTSDVYNNKFSNLNSLYIRMFAITNLIHIYINSYKNVDLDIEDIIHILESIFTDELLILDKYSMFSLYNLIYNFKIKALKFFYNIYYNSTNTVVFNFPFSPPPLVAAWEIYGNSLLANDLRKYNIVNNLVFSNDVVANV